MTLDFIKNYDSKKLTESYKDDSDGIYKKILNTAVEAMPSQNFDVDKAADFAIQDLWYGKKAFGDLNVEKRINLICKLAYRYGFDMNDMLDKIEEIIDSQLDDELANDLYEMNLNPEEDND